MFELNRKLISQREKVDLKIQKNDELIAKINAQQASLKEQSKDLTLQINNNMICTLQSKFNEQKREISFEDFITQCYQTLSPDDSLNAVEAQTDIPDKDTDESKPEFLSLNQDEEDSLT